MEKKESGYLVGLWLTDMCNLRCQYCFQDRDTDPKRMDDKTLDATIKFINDMDPISGVAFFGAEPLMHKRGLKRVLAQTNAPKYFITTNGTLLDDDIFDWLEFKNVHMNLSLDGMKDTQDRWRDNSYDRIMENLPKILRHLDLVGGQVLLTAVMESQLFRNVKHIKDLGFRSVYINQLDPYAQKVKNEMEKIDIYKEQYMKILTELHDHDGFEVSDFLRWKAILNQNKLRGSCGFHNKGLGVDPQGNLFPCHRGPELPKEFSFGNVFDGFDKEKERQIRALGQQPPMCDACDIHFSQCPIACYQEHENFGINPDPIHCAYERAKIDVMREFIGMQPTEGEKPDVLQDVRLAVGTLVDPHKYYILPIFLKHLIEMKFPVPTDYYFVMDEHDHKTYKLLDNWKDNRYKDFAPFNPDLVRHVRVIRIPTYVDDTWMDRITRGRDLLLNQVLKGTYTHLFWLDSDILTPPDTVSKLIAAMGADPDRGISGGLVKTRNEFTRNVWFNTYMDKRAEGKGFPSKTDFIPGDIINVDATGSDCVIISRRTLESVGAYTWNQERQEGEDMTFCLKAKELGIRTVIHTGVETKHLGISDIMLKSEPMFACDEGCQIECQSWCQNNCQIHGQQ